MKVKEIVFVSQTVLMLQPRPPLGVQADPLYLLADAVNDLLGEDEPCGYPEPEIMSARPVSGGMEHKTVIRVRELDGDYTPSELRSICRMFLRKCDDAEAT